MPNYRRPDAAGATFFFTVITLNRRAILTEPVSRQALRESIQEVREDMPFEIDSWVLLPDHLHAMWTLPPEDGNFSIRWGRIKKGFTSRVRSFFDEPALLTSSRRMRRESTIWQRRFWDHQIRNEADYRRHMDYVHYNPVKHGLVRRAADWPYSSIHRWVKRGLYSADWGVAEACFEGQSFGEP